MNVSGSSLGSTSPRRTALGNAAVLRPRPSKLLSGLENDGTLNEPSSHLQGGESLAILGSPMNSRAPSPIPSKHPSRSNSSNRLTRDEMQPKRDNSNDLAASFSELWGKSWTSLQGIASNVLGSDTSGDFFKDKGPERRRRPFEATHSRPGHAKTWGPEADETVQPGAGTNESRAALVRAKKRQEMLMSNGDPFNDVSSRLKRRTSDDFNSISAPPGDYEDREALVYIHHVSKEDTLAGISIRYNCQLATLKKANRMWAQDSIQTRIHLIIPVDACSIRGRRVAGPEKNVQQPDILMDGLLSNGNAPAPLPSPLELPTSTISPMLKPGKSPDMTTPSPPRSQTEEAPWKHDSWILLEGQTAPVEIARLARRELGFFPRTRRRSLSYSDLNDSSRLSSFDLSRPAVAIADALESVDSLGVSSANIEGSTTRPGSSSEQPSVASHRRSSSTQKFAAQMLHGPGGVGTLAGHGPSAPGPGADKLNKVFAKHLPNMVVPQPTSHPDSTIRGADDSSIPIGAASSNRLNYAAGSGGASGIENVGTTIETWMRKFARSAAKAVEQAPLGSINTNNASQKAKSLGVRGLSAERGGRGPGGAGDLIELSDAGEPSGREAERGRTLAPGTPATSTLLGGRLAGTGSSSNNNHSGSRNRHANGRQHGALKTTTSSPSPSLSRTGTNKRKGE